MAVPLHNKLQKYNLLQEQLGQEKLGEIFAAYDLEKIILKIKFSKHM